MSYEKDLKRVEDAAEALGRLFGSSRPAGRRAELAGIALSRTAQRLLWFVVTEGPIRVSDLARTAGTTDPIVSRQVAAMEAQGLVERQASARDGRVSLVRATALGRRAGRSLRRAADEIFQEQMRDWSAKDLADLAPLLERLARDLRRGPDPAT